MSNVKAVMVGPLRKGQKKRPQVLIATGAVATRKRKTKAKGQGPAGGAGSMVAQCCRLMACAIVNAFGSTTLQRPPTGGPMRSHVERYKVRIIVTPDANGVVQLAAFPGLPGGLIVNRGIIANLPTVDGGNLPAFNASTAGVGIGVPFTEWSNVIPGSMNTEVQAPYFAEQGRCLGWGLRVQPTGSVLNMTGEALIARGRFEQNPHARGPVNHGYVDPATAGVTYAAAVWTEKMLGYNGLGNTNFNALATSMDNEIYSLVPGVSKKGTGREFQGTCDKYGEWAPFAGGTVETQGAGNFVNNDTFMLRQSGLELPVAQPGVAQACFGGIAAVGGVAAIFPRATAVVPPVGATGPGPCGFAWTERNGSYLIWTAEGLPAASPLLVEFGLCMDMVLDPITSPRRKDLQPVPALDVPSMQVAGQAASALPLSVPPSIPEQVVDHLKSAGVHTVNQILQGAGRVWSEQAYLAANRLAGGRGAAGTGYWGESLGLM